MTEAPSNLRYTKDHEWISLEGNIATIGVTDYAQHSLGDLVYVELPEVGVSLSKGDTFATVESVKAASEVYSPVSGTVIEVNEKLTDSPETINTSPYEEGWMVKVKIEDKSELDYTMDDNEYLEHVE